MRDGKRAIVFVLGQYADSDAVNKAEVMWIAYFRLAGFDLTNGTEGGTGGRLSPESLLKAVENRRGYKHSDETRRKISEGNIGKIGAMRGRRHSEETKRKMSESRTGLKSSITEAGRASRKEKMKNYFVSDETKKKMSIAKKAMGPKSEQYRKECSERDKLRQKGADGRYLPSK